jgi:LPS-assembly protein
MVMDNPFYKPEPVRDGVVSSTPGIECLLFALCPMRLPSPELNALRSGPGFALRPLALLVCLLCQGEFARAQAVEAVSESPAEPLLKLKSSPFLQDSIDPVQRSQMPTFLFGDRLTGQTDKDMALQGQAELRRGDTVIRSDRLSYEPPDDKLRASGNVRVNRAGNVFEGPELELKVDAFEGFFEQPNYRFLATGAHGEADRINFLDDKRAVVLNATYTSCQRTAGPAWLPDWLMRFSAMEVDTEDDVAVATDAKLIFKGSTLLSLSSLSFPLSDKRKSGVLPPTFGVDSTSGTVVTVPYYWNIAPNRDATLYPTVMSSRGFDLGGEFRYLEQSYSGQLRANYLPGDTLRGTDRWGAAYQHRGIIDTGLPAVGNLGLNLNLNRVSDDNYWRDFPRGGTALTQRLLPNDVSLNWAKGDYSAALRTLSWQTLQDVSSPIVPPYDRMPQLMARYGRLDVNGFDFSVEGDTTQFQANRGLTGQPNAQRSFMLSQISRPWLSAAGFITPKLQLHASTYQFDAPLANGDSTASRVVPTFSLDSGLVFERDASYLGQNFRQTLEPRLFYVYTPFRDQSKLPNYDSGAYDFNFSSIYTENAFVGNDRIADNNLLTAGVSTRLLDPTSGAQLASFGMAQRYRFADQSVTLPGGNPALAGLSDVMLGATVNWDRHWILDSTVQYNPSTTQSVRSSVGTRYTPAPFKVLNVAYRFQRDVSELIDVGWQWPLTPAAPETGRWYTVGRLNYSLPDSKLVDSILGFEYDAGCWVGRVVVERLSTGLATTSQRIMFQLELVGFSRLGIDPLTTLKNNIPRYQTLREQVSPISRFSNYE